MQKIVNVASIVTLIGACDDTGKSRVYVIPNERNARRSEIHVVNDDPRAILIADWSSPYVAEQVSHGIARLLRELGVDAAEVVLCDD